MPTLDAVIKDLHEQWDLLRAWVDELPDPASSEPSTLPGWTVGTLVAHLGRNMDAIVALRPVDPEEGLEPLSLSGYLATYRGVDPERMDRLAHDVFPSIADDVTGGIDRFAEQAFAHLEGLAAGGEDAVVEARRGVIGLVDFLVSRLLELVVHGYDLAPTLPLPTPVDPTARTIVAEALLEVVEEGTGYRLDVVDEEAWILAASGRIDWPTAVERGAVRPSEVSDGTPDLTPSLPLL